MQLTARWFKTLLAFVKAQVWVLLGLEKMSANLAMVKLIKLIEMAIPTRLDLNMESGAKLPDWASSYFEIIALGDEKVFWLSRDQLIFF